MPRSVRERIFFERVSGSSGASDWPVRCFRELARTYFGLRPSPRPSVAIRPLPIYSKALAFERAVDFRRFDDEFRKGPAPDSFKAINKRAVLFEARKETERKASCRLKEKSYNKSLSNYKDGQ